MPLPIDSALPELLTALATHANVVLQAPPGAGKSTRVPLALLEADWLGSQKIVMLEPRRLAARAVAMRMAQTLGEQVGRTVGYRTRLETRVSRDTRIEVVTEGILTRWMQNDAALEGVALVIFDEFHERSLNADLGLALCLDVQSALRDDLKLLVMSATLDGAAVSTLLGDAPIVTSEGRSFPVDIRYAQGGARPRNGVEPRLEQRVASVIARAIAEEPGDVLAFLPGQGEIRRTQEQLEQRDLPPRTQILPLYGELDAKQQDAALQPSAPGQRKIVLATTIAETSLTIDGVRIVIDSGLARRARFDPTSGMGRLELLRISRASAAQRAGRAGRLESGVCYRLWSESEHASLAAHTPAEILDADLAPLALELAAWGIRDPNALRWLDPPPSATYAQAIDLLRLLGAIDREQRITAHGRELASLATHPRLAHMILRSAAFGGQQVALRIAALLGERDLLRFAGRDKDVDLRSRLDALEGGRVRGDAQIDHGAKQRVKRALGQLHRQLRIDGDANHLDTDLTGEALALAYPDRVAQSRGDGGRYLLSNGRGAQLPPAQELAKHDFLVVADLDAGERDATIRLAAPLSRESLAQLFAEQIETRERIQWDSREQVVVARREQWLGALKLLERRLERPEAARVAQAMLAGIREMGLECLPWTKEARQLQQRLIFARRTETRADNPWPDVSDAALLGSLEGWLAPWLDNMSRRDHLARLDLHAILTGSIDWSLQQRLNSYAPTHLTVPSGSRISIDYSGDAPSVAVRLQELFGLQTTPAIADNRVPLTIELLSPAHRPVQITRDLASFWATGYAEVKKDLKGRYPKHYWPDDPLTAEPTARAKPRKPA
jgi:ATP-dependent helicase HrpB